MNVSFVGSGNVATALAVALREDGCNVLQVCSRNAEHSRQLAQRVDAQALCDPASLSPDNDIIVLAVTDDAIASVAARLPRRDWTVLHTAGSVPMDVLKPAAERYGVLWPVCSIRKEMPANFGGVPVCIEGSSPQVVDTLGSLVAALGSHCEVLTSPQRRQLHLGAVVVNNFGNALLALAQEHLQRHDISPTLLQALARQTFANAEGNLWQRQTGPASRNDTATMASHRLMLADDVELLQLYNLFSDNITRHCPKP